MEVKAIFEPNLATEKKLNELPNQILYSVARETLDMSYPSIPMSVGRKTSGALRTSSVANGVRSCPGGYYIGSFTDYASYVWQMNDSTTNWTTPGTHSQWYARTLQKNGRTIIDIAISRNKLK